MDQQKHRGVSLGTILMLIMTVGVLVGCAVVLPQLMGSANIRMEDRAMQSSTNLSESLPELTMSEIPLTRPTESPVLTEVPALTPTPASQAPPVPAETPVPKLSGTVNLTFGGSVNVDDLIRKSGYYPDSEKYDFTENLALIASEMDSDCTLITLESIADPSGNVKQIPNAPAEVMDMLASAHVDMVALGYNRAFDRGLNGLQATTEQAAQRGMETLGAYADQTDAERFRIVEINGIRVAYLHYVTAVTSAGRKEMKNTPWAMPVVSISDGPETICADIRRVREAGAHIVVVSLNWSGNDSVNPAASRMKNFMQQLADAGADLIIGAGTKAVKEVNWLISKNDDGTTRQTLCAWSLGSLLNGERGNGNVAGMLLHVQLKYVGGVVSFERAAYTPTYIWRFKQDDYYRYRVVASDQPAPDGMDDDQASYAARALETLRKALGNSPVTIRIK